MGTQHLALAVIASMPASHAMDQLPLNATVVSMILLYLHHKRNTFIPKPGVQLAVTISLTITRLLSQNNATMVLIQLLVSLTVEVVAVCTVK